MILSRRAVGQATDHVTQHDSIGAYPYVNVCTFYHARGMCACMRVPAGELLSGCAAKLCQRAAIRRSVLYLSRARVRNDIEPDFRRRQHTGCLPDPLYHG